MYEALRGAPLDVWERGDAKEIQRHLPIGDGELDELNLTAVGPLCLFGRIAHEYDRKTFAEALRDDELPPLELSETEMEAVRGGRLAENAREALDWFAEQLRT